MIMIDDNAFSNMKSNRVGGPFCVGDLVVIADGVHDEAMPESRMGVIVERLGDSGSDWTILMTNGNRMKFNSYFLHKVVSDKSTGDDK